MSVADPSRVLKSNVKRTVTLEPVDGVLRVVKRFHAPGALDRLKDRHRAHREYRTLEALAARGLPVPAPLQVRRREGRWELVQEQVADALSLDEILEGRAPWPVPAGRVAASLGRLLAALHRAGVHHPDLHAGNVLIDRAGHLRLVDLARARLGAAPDVTRLLVRLAAGLRERTSPLFRTRALLALRAAAPGALPGSLAARIAPIEGAARRLRRERVLRRVARWWRESGALRPFDRDGWRGFLRRDVPEDRLAALAALAGGQTLPLGGDTEALAVESRSVAELRPRWEVAARYAMHHLPGERPLALFTHPVPRAILEVPRGARPLEQAWAQLDAAAREALAASAGATLGALRDRGLELRGGSGSGLLATPDGRVHLGPGSLHEARGMGLDPSPPRPTFLPAPTPGEVRAFQASFVAADRTTAVGG